MQVWVNRCCKNEAFQTVKKELTHPNSVFLFCWPENQVCEAAGRKQQTAGTHLVVVFVDVLVQFVQRHQVVELS